MQDRLSFAGIDFIISREAAAVLPDGSLFSAFQSNTIFVRVEWEDDTYVVVFPVNWLAENYTQDELIAAAIWAVGAGDESEDDFIVLDEA